MLCYWLEADSYAFGHFNVRIYPTKHEGRAANDELVENTSSRPNVHPLVILQAHQQLRAAVPQGTHALSDDSDGDNFQCCFIFGLRLDHFSQLRLQLAR